MRATARLEYEHDPLSGPPVQRDIQEETEKYNSTVSPRAGSGFRSGCRFLRGLFKNSDENRRIAGHDDHGRDIERNEPVDFILKIHDRKTDNHKQTACYHPSVVECREYHGWLRGLSIPPSASLRSHPV
jgi:hypothetical protein